MKNYFQKEEAKTGGHGKGTWGISTGSQTGFKRFRCPICNKQFVIGSLEQHNWNSILFDIDTCLPLFDVKKRPLTKDNRFYCPVIQQYVENFNEGEKPLHPERVYGGS